ncbi:MAG: hypothetical protein M3417_12370 [Actinomycetota bacterium]|nr:hypothetical protein [Actinomycetota bacterium]
MSYDLIGVRPHVGESVAEAVERLEEFEDASPSPQARAEIKRIAAALLDIDTSAHLHEDSDERTMELSPDRFQVSVFEHEAAITIPYWTSGTDDASLDAVAPYIEVLRSAGGFVIFDLQTEEVVSFGQALSGYAESAAVVLPELDAIEDRREGASLVALFRDLTGRADRARDGARADPVEPCRAPENTTLEPQTAS